MRSQGSGTGVRRITPHAPVGLRTAFRAQGHRVVNVFHVVEVLASIKQLRVRASDTVIWVPQRGATAEDTGRVHAGKAP